ncbi:MAG: hypothetical protein OEO23_02175 [Gemmatimonadota bacterium]|nr:hypothetical protein [Gemmatimonadota bacterium]
MLGLISLAVAGTAGVLGHVKSKDWVRRKLRYTTFVEKPGIGIIAGAATAIAAAPLVAVLPLVGAGTALALGAGVGTGVAIGAREARDG